MSSPLLPELSIAFGGIQLKEGRGCEPDNFDEKSIWVYDSEKHPITPREQLKIIS